MRTVIARWMKLRECRNSIALQSSIISAATMAGGSAGCPSGAVLGYALSHCRSVVQCHDMNTRRLVIDVRADRGWAARACSCCTRGRGTEPYSCALAAPRVSRGPSRAAQREFTRSREGATLSFCLRSMSAVSIARGSITDCNSDRVIRTLHHATPAVDVHCVDSAAGERCRLKRLEFGCVNLHCALRSAKKACAQ